MKGYWKKRLMLDLGTGEASQEVIDKKILNDFVGGRGINSHFLLMSETPRYDALSSENCLVIGTGPCNGTAVPGSSRFTISARSPLTGFLGDSNSGAPFGAELKYAGYDQIIIRGRAEKPAYVVIEDDRVEIRDAGHLWGLETDTTQSAIRKELRDSTFEVVCIGPAGENLVRFASIIGGLENASGRTGMGAVMGSKNLKAIAVRGSRLVQVAEKERFGDVVRKVKDALASDPKWHHLWTTLGPTGLVEMFHRAGTLPARNFQTGIADVDGLRGEDFLREFHVKYNSCFSCPIHCGHLYRSALPDGSEYFGVVRTFAAAADLGIKMGLRNYASILKNQKRVNELGLDVISTGGVISWVMECYEKGALSEKDLDGIQATWGNAGAIVELIECIATRTGIGDILGEGSHRAAEELGKPTAQYLVTTKKMEMTDMDPRGMKAWGLGYATSSRGPCHTRAYPAAEQYPSEIVKRWTGFEVKNPLSEDPSKGRLVAWYEDLRALSDCMETCKFYSRSALVNPEIFCDLLKCVTGKVYSAEDLLRVGERIINAERIYNLRCGLSREDDSLPDKFTKIPMPEGPCGGETVHIDGMLKAYYESRGWDPKTGIPTDKKLRELGLGPRARTNKNPRQARPMPRLPRVGLIIPSSNTTLEMDFNRSFKREATIHAARMYMEVVTRANEKKMIREDLPRAVDLIGSLCPDVIVFGCTSGGAVGGLEHDRKIASWVERRSKVKCITVLSSVIQALKKEGCRQIGVLTPYIQEVNEDIRKSLTQARFRVRFIHGMGLVHNVQVGRVTPREIFRFAQEVGPPLHNAQALFFSCANWRALEALPQLRRVFEIPIITSNQAVIEAVKDFLRTQVSG
jgi:aldehyde:ferredoxin oxidoreductase